MFLKDLRTYVRLQFLALVESLMSSPQPSNAPYLFPLESRPFDVDNWADYALREDFYALSTSSTIKKVTQRKATTAKGHEFVDVEIQTPDAMTFVTTDRGPSKNNNASSSLPSALPPSSRGNSCKVISFRPVPADDSVWVPQAGSKACLDLYTFSTHGEHNEICTLTWQDENLEPKMSVAQLAVLLRAIHGHSKQYIADSNSCYWHAFTVVEVIRGKFSAVQTNGTAFSERGMYKRWKPDLEDAVQTVSQLYDAAWEKCVVQAQERADAIRIHEENARAAASAHEDRQAKREAEIRLKWVEQDLQREADRQKIAEAGREREKERANRLEAELQALRQTRRVSGADQD